MSEYFKISSIDVVNKKFTAALTEEGRQSFDSILYRFAGLGGIVCEFKDYSELNNPLPIIMQEVKKFYEENIEFAEQKLNELKEQFELAKIIINEV